MYHMKRIKLFSIASVAVLAAGMGFTSCADKLDLGPIDHYGSGSFWKTEAQAVGNIHTLMASLRANNWQTTITFGELRGGAYTLATSSSDGNNLSDQYIREHNLNASANYGPGNFGGYWDEIADINLFIHNVKDASYFSSEDKKNYCLGVVHGLRAYYYFIMYRNYGGVPLRLVPDVENGNFDPTTLYMKRSTAAQTLAQIKDDIKLSLEYFGTQTSFNFDGNSKNAKYYWSKAATEMLAGEVYLWSAKVAVDDQPAMPNDLSQAKTFYENVIEDYGLSLQENFAEVFSSECNSEIIFAIQANETEVTNSIPSAFVYNMTTGYTWQNDAYDCNGNKFGDVLQVQSSGMPRYQYANALWYQYDAEDTRRDATFTTSWHDAACTQLRGVFISKNLGTVLKETGRRCYNGDQPVYRLAEAYLALAEIANMQGEDDDVVKYINIIRDRAYGKAWNVDTYGYKAGSFLENEVAILQEKDKEFVQEGKRWYDVRRMTSVKDGKDTDHLLFCKEGHIAYGLEITENMKELNANKWEKVENPEELEIVVAPLLPKDLAYRVLWPLSDSYLQGDKELTQTTGY